MANTTEKNEVPTISIPYTRNQNGLDVDAFVEEARKQAEAFKKQDDVATKAYSGVVEKILTGDAHKNQKHHTSKVIATLALHALGVYPNDKALKEADMRVRVLLDGQPEKFLRLSAGPSAGYHIKSRYDADTLAKLQKQATAAAAKEAAVKAAEDKAAADNA